MSSPVVRVVVFDLGGVLFDWDPHHLYRELIPDDAARERFLSTVCSGAWRHQQDAGQSLAEGTAELLARHPGEETLIRAFYGRWPQMLKGVLPAGMALFEALRTAGVPLYALTNWASETWRYTWAHYPFLQHFRDIVVSGDEGVAKPDRRIYERMHARIAVDFPQLAAAEVAFIDDMPANVAAAQAFGWRAIHHTHADRTRQALLALGVTAAFD